MSESKGFLTLLGSVEMKQWVEMVNSDGWHFIVVRQP